MRLEVVGKLDVLCEVMWEPFANEAMFDVMFLIHSMDVEFDETLNRDISQ